MMKVNVMMKKIFFLDSSRRKEMMVPFHIDNGMYLIITPFPGHGLKIQTSSGEIIDTDELGYDSIIVLMGRGLTDWLLVDHPKQEMFHAVPHAVDTLGSEMSTRVIYARMKIAPIDAEPLASLYQDYGGIKVTFGDVFYNQGAVEADQLCTTDLDGSEKVLGKNRFFLFFQFF